MTDNLINIILMIGYIIVIVIIFGLVYLSFGGSKDLKQTDFLVVGLRNSGKTYLIHKLNNTEIETFPSLEKYEYNILYKDINYSFIDFPGNNKFEGDIIEAINSCKSIIYVIDSSDM